MSEEKATQESWLKRNADALERWQGIVFTLGGYVLVIDDLHQHAYIRAALWFAPTLYATWGVVDDARQARRKAVQARQQQLRVLAELFREVAARRTES
ncbi:hypothetical protein ACFZDK_37160 [Streptomyces sp. NPDC007901]|uniref:hypothetical protein n=1 Tax=Streptomyces sp. NPDC007901 TaxID=3364785 RepID=UPI0036E44341